MNNTPRLDDFIPDNLTVTNERRKLFHVFDKDDCYALWAAYSAGRPLLVRGEPGTGKSQMAQAIAEQLGWAFVSEVIRGNTELDDLHHHYDAIGRLGEAQTRAMAEAAGNRADGDPDRLNPLNFLSPGAFWWAYHWQSAEKQYNACRTRLRPAPEKPDPTAGKGIDWQPDSGGVVLLIDEIDKGEPDLPNGLLETLGQYCFTLPYINSREHTSEIPNPIRGNPSRLLIVITTNEERELPRAFVRRCFVHTLKMEESEEKVDQVEKRYQWLIKRGRLHFGGRIAEDVYKEAAEQLWKDRAANPHSQFLPGLAEYIDLLQALADLDKKEQKQRLQDIKAYALKKEAQ